jgi:hypothetical protein
MTVRGLLPRRGAAWITVVVTTAVIAGVAGGIWPATSQRTSALALADARTGPMTLNYACRFPAGTYQVGVRVTALYPATAVASRPVRPTSLTLAVTVPAAALANLGSPGTAVAVAARVATSGVRGASRTRWASLAASPAPLPVAGQDLASAPLRPTAPLPSLTATRAGIMTVTAGRLELRFTSPRAAPVTAACTLKPGQEAALAAIAVRNATPSQAAAQQPPCPPLPPGGLNLNPRFPLPKPPPGSTITSPQPQPGCAYIVGYTNVRKLNGAALVGPGLVNVAIGVRLVVNLGQNYFEEDSAAQLDYRPCRTCQYVHALPPARTTFLGFGFMPVSATMQLTEIGTMNIIGVGTGFTLTSNTAWSLMELRIYDVKVNGQPLAVGPHCQTVRPLLIKLTGVSSGSQPYSLQGGGPLIGQVTIPPFTGCGVTENLNPLFTGTVSGPGNYAKLTQGSLCNVTGGLGCPPPIPSPLR